MSWLSERLAALVSERGLSLPQVARDLAIERAQLAQIVAGTRTPNEVLTRRLATYFGEEPASWVQSVEPARVPETTPEPVASAFVRVAGASEVRPGEMLAVLDNRAVIANVEGTFLAFANVCPHAGAYLAGGFLDGYVVECPWHAGRWDVRTGEALTMIATADIERYEVRVQGPDIEIRLV